MEHEYDVVIHAARVLTPEGEGPRTVCVRNGVVVAVEDLDPGAAGTYRTASVVTLADDEVLIPGLVDTHVHVNDPGRTEWEGFRSATRAAAAGGVTTLVDMPLNSIPPTCDLPALELKRQTAQGVCFVDVGFWGGAVPGNLPALAELHEAGVFGFKCFLLHSGVDEFAPLTGPELDAAMQELATFGAMMIVHAEDANLISEAPQADGPAYHDFLASRPRAAETRAIAQVIAVARRTGCRAHILHLANADALPMIAEARADGIDISVETCPHYLTLAAEEIADGATEFKCCPPIREAANQDRLWEGLASGAIDFVVSDHSPSTVELKRLDVGDFALAWGGISSLQVALSAIWTAARGRGHTLLDVVGWMAERPAERVGLTRKGRIAVGADADFAVFAPDEEYTVDVEALFHKNPVTPYAGRTLAGRVRATWLRGVDITDDVTTDARPQGRLLTRGET